MPVKYIGSKRTLVPVILETIQGLCPTGTVLDLFAGTSRVGHALKAAGYRVLANDHLSYAHAIATCYVQADAEDWHEAATALLAELDALPGRPGYVTETFCQRSRFFQPHNGARIDAIREAIEARDLHPELRAIALVSLLEAADRVDSTTGVQMAYLKQWASRSARTLELRLPDLLPRATAGKGEAHALEAADAAARLPADVAYLDPPYNQHSYLGNYHIWETLVRWDRPETYGVACKRVDCRTRKSPFNRKRTFLDAWTRIVETVQARFLVVSFNDEGYIDREAMATLLSRRGPVQVIANDHKRYVGAQIGIHDRQGVRVGTPGARRNTEFLYVVRVEA